MSDEERSAASEDAVLGWASVKSDAVGITPEERERNRRDVAERAARARGELTTRGMEAIGARMQDSQTRLDALEGVTANQQAMLDEIFEVMGEVVDARTPAASRRPHLRLVRPDERDAG